MPTLQFKGKNIIWNHHMNVSYHTIVENPDLSYMNENCGDHIIFEGDNLIALKALLPQYAGCIKCVYIDPPYNIGTEKWIYNDRVNSPLIKEWIGKEVGRDDLTRHDKWLCMMTPRLKLLRELMSDDGVIFISIDNNEYQNLRLLMDEIFLESNFIGTFIWRKKEGGGQTKAYFVTEHEYIMVYRKSEQFKWIDEVVTVEVRANGEDENGKYVAVKLAKWGNTARREDRPSMHFPIEDPDGGNVLPVAPDGNPGRWRVGKTRMKDLISKELIHWEKKEDKWIAYEKIHYSSDEKEATLKDRSILFDFGTTADGTNTLTDLFGSKDVFENPKPVDLIKYFIERACDKNQYVLDSFAGSGTTMQATLALNQEDGGNRKCILVQMTEATAKEPSKNICKDITKKRIELAIQKYNYKDGFKYYELGTPMDPISMLAGKLPSYKQLASYVYYLCTGKTDARLSESIDEAYCIGMVGNTTIHLVYSDTYDELMKMALNIDLAELIKGKYPKHTKIVYAPACFLDEDYMRSNNIEFVGIPYNLYSAGVE